MRMSGKPNRFKNDDLKFKMKLRQCKIHKVEWKIGLSTHVSCPEKLCSGAAFNLMLQTSIFVESTSSLLGSYFPLQYNI